PHRHGIAPTPGLRAEACTCLKISQTGPAEQPCFGPLRSVGDCDMKAFRMTVMEFVAVILMCHNACEARSDDMVLRWNEVVLAAITTAGQSPVFASRTVAIVQAAVYDAVNSIDRSYTPYLATIPAPTGADESAAAAQAAHDALVGLFPTQSVV